MSSSKSAIAPDLIVKPSRILRGYLILLSILSLIIVWSLSMLEWYFQIVLSGLILFSAYRALQQHEQVVFLKHKMDERWLLGLKDGVEVKATLLNQYYVTPWVVVVNFKSVLGKRYPVVLLGGRVDGEALRGMRVYLKQLRNSDKKS